MTNRKVAMIDGGSAEYWRQRKAGFAFIREAERAAEALERAPLYIAGRWDDDYGDYEPVENLEPVNRMEDAIQAIEASGTAVSILTAQARTKIGNYEIGAVMRELASDDRRVEDPIRNPLWVPDTD